jgi:hypothetical protein
VFHLISRLVTGWNGGVMSRLGMKWWLFLVMVGLLGIVAWQTARSSDTPNLLTNPDFNDTQALVGWQMAGGQTQTSLRLVSYPPDNQALILEIPNSNGSWVGVGQRVLVDPVKVYQIAVNFRLVQPEQSSAQLVVRLSQFDPAGALVATDEFAIPGALMTASLPSDPSAWQAARFNFVSHWRAAKVEAGIGLLGQQATALEVDNLTLQIAPIWLNAVRSNPLALISALTVLGIAAYVGWLFGRPLVIAWHQRQVRLARKTGSIWWEVGVVTLLYLGVAIGLTYPVSWQLNKALAGDPGWDALQFAWYQWWIKEALLDLGIWPDQAQSLFYPLVAMHPILALHSYVPFVSIPLTLVWGPLTSYNLAFLSSLVLSGLTSYLLGRYLGFRPAAAVVMGLIFAFYPNRVGHAVAGHLTFVTNYFLPLYTLSLLILLKRPSTRLVIWHGLVTFILAWANPMHIGYGIMPLVLFITGGFLWRQFRGTQPDWPHLKKVGRALILSILLAILLYLPFAGSTLLQGPGFLEVDSFVGNSTDLLAFVLPSPYNPVLEWLGLAPPASWLGVTRERDLGEPLAFLGVVAIGLAGVAVWRRWQAARLWFGLVVVCAVLSMGPVLKMGTQPQDITLPYHWLTYLPFFEWSRTPGRFIETTMLGLAVLAAMGLDYLLSLTVQSAGRRVIGYAAVILVGLLILAEYTVISPFPTEALPISTYYHSLANEPLTGGVLELMPRRISNYAMYYQTVHEQPLAGGYISRSPRGTAEYRRFLHQFLWPWARQNVFSPLGVNQIRAILADMKIERVIAQRDSMDGDSGTATLNYLPILFGPPIFEDEHILVYTVPPLVKDDLPAWQLMPDQKNWSVTQDGTALSLDQKGNLYIYAAQPGAALLELQLTPSFSSTELRLALNDVPVQPHQALATGPMRAFLLTLQPGFNHIRLSTHPSQVVEFEKISIKDLNR